MANFLGHLRNQYEFGHIIVDREEIAQGFMTEGFIAELDRQFGAGNWCWFDEDISCARFIGDVLQADNNMYTFSFLAEGREAGNMLLDFALEDPAASNARFCAEDPSHGNNIIWFGVIATWSSHQAVLDFERRMMAHDDLSRIRVYRQTRGK